MSQCVEVRRACAVPHPQPSLTCGFKAGIVALTLRPQGVSPLKIEAAAVNGKSVIVWNGRVFRAAPVFLPKEGAFFQRDRLIRGREDLSGDGRIGDVARRGQLVERQTGDTVHQHMAFVSPVELIPPLIVLVGGRMDAQSAVRVAFGVVFLGELAFRKGLRVVLLRVRHDGCGIQTNERRIHHAQLIQLPHQIGHDRLQRTVVQLPQAAVIRPVGRQRLHDVKAAVMGDDAVVVQIIHQICDLRETLAFHNDKRTDHGFFGEAPPPGCRPGQREVQTAEKLVVERSGALGCKQRHILNDFLSVDSGQPLSGWFSFKSILPKGGTAFYINGVISYFSHGRKLLRSLRFLRFAHGWWQEERR